MEAIDISSTLLFFLFVVAVIAGFCDTLAGGGGLIVMPALIACGFPPLLALGTNKLQSTAGTVTASWMMFKHKKELFSQVRWLLLLSLLGSAFGALLVQKVDQQLLTSLIPLVLLCIVVYFIFAPQLSYASAKPRWMQLLYRRVAVPVIAWYDGFLGPGTGSFFTLAGVSLQGKTIVEATSAAKTLNCASNCAAMLVFIGLGQVLWSVGLVMIVGQLIGAYIGSRCLFIIKAQYLRYFVVVMSLSMLGKYMWSLL